MSNMRSQASDGRNGVSADTTRSIGVPQGIGGTGIERPLGTDTCNAGGQAGDFSAPPPDCNTVT
jgi:hypothetical protein